MKKASILFMIFLFLSCATTKQNNIVNNYWVNSAKVDCVGVAPMTCLQIQKGKTINQENWELFYSSIEGFDYKPGFIYKLKIKEEHLDNVPADASSIKYSLIEVLEKKKDKRFQIHDIWVLETIVDNDSLDLTNIKNRPQIEINVSQMKVFGNNGCNNISGSIKTLDDSNIAFTTFTETRMMCPNMELPRLFTLALLEVTNYTRKGNKLILLNKEDKEILVFKKTD